MSVKIGSSAPAPHAMHATQGKKNPRNKEKEDKTTEVATKTFPINGAGQPKPLKSATKKAKVEEEYSYPLSEEEWTKKPKTIGMVEWGVYNASVYTFVTPLLKHSPEAITALKGLDKKEITSYGKIEEFAVRILKLSMTCSNARKQEVHERLQVAIKKYAETESLWDSMDAFKAIANKSEITE